MPIDRDELRCIVDFGGATGIANGTPTQLRPRMATPHDGFTLVGINLLGPLEVTLTSIAVYDVQLGQCGPPVYR